MGYKNNLLEKNFANIKTVFDNCSSSKFSIHLRVKTAWFNRVQNESNNTWNDQENILNYQSDTKD